MTVNVKITFSMDTWSLATWFDSKSKQIREPSEWPTSEIVPLKCGFLSQKMSLSRFSSFPTLFMIVWQYIGLV